MWSLKPFTHRSDIMKYAYLNLSLMKPGRLILALVSLLMVGMPVSLHAEKDFLDEIADASDSFPVPSGNPNQLFYLQRTPNSNTVVYELNVDNNGQLNREDPIHVFWIRYPEGGVRKELSYIQRHFAYGLKAELMEDGRYNLIFAAYKKKNLYLMQSPQDKKYHVYTTFGGRQVVLKKVFIQIDPGGTFWAPNVRYIEMKGKEPASGYELSERIIIN